jgi:hypothetical protein
MSSEQSGERRGRLLDYIDAVLRHFLPKCYSMASHVENHSAELELQREIRNASNPYPNFGVEVEVNQRESLVGQPNRIGPKSPTTQALLPG